MTKDKKVIKEIFKQALPPEVEHPYQIPENWIWVKFDSVIKTSKNRGSAIKQKDYEELGEIPVVDQGIQLISGYTNNKETQYTGELPVIVFGDHTRCIKWIDFNFAQGADGTKLLKPLSKLYPKYFYHLLKSINLPNKGYSRHFKYLRESLLPIPPLTEQIRIVDKLELLLSKIEDAKQLIKEVKESYELRRAAIMYKAFQGELFATSSNKITKKINDRTTLEIPEHWEVKSLSDIVENHSSKRVPVSKKKRENMQGDIPYYGATGIVDFVDGYTHEGEFVCIGEDGANLLSRSKPQAFLIQGKSWVNNHAHVVKMKNNMSNNYLMHYINFIPLHDYVTGTAQPKLSRKNLDKIPIVLPPIDEQILIANKIDNLLLKELEITNILDSNSHLINNIKQSILNKAFRGELGTNDPIEESALDLL